MDNNNSKITEDYKFAISDILTKISRGLGDEVTEKVGNKVKDLSLSVNEKIERSSQLLSSFDSKISSFTEKIDVGKSFDRIESEIKSVEKIVLRDNKSNTNNLVNTIHSDTEQITEVVKHQKELGIIRQDLTCLKNDHSNLSESIIKMSHATIELVSNQSSRIEEMYIVHQNEQKRMKDQIANHIVKQGKLNRFLHVILFIIFGISVSILIVILLNK